MSAAAMALPFAEESRDIPESSLITLHDGQMKVYASPARFRVVVAGRRWGKTKLSQVEIIKRAKHARRKIWYIAPTYRMAKQIMWEELVEAIPKKWVKKVNETTMTIRLRNKTIIECKGADKPDTLRGVGLDYVVLDEFQDMKREVWTTVIQPTLATTGGGALFIGTPKSFNHLYDLYILGKDDRMVRQRQWESWQFPTITSPFIPAEEIARARRDMDEKSFKQEFEASFETMSGRVYYPFDRKIHVGDFEFNPKLPIWIGQDFNNDPMSSVIMQPQIGGGLVVVDEIMLRNASTSDVCDEIERRYWRWMDQITIYPDPAGGQTQHARGETDLDIMRERGFRRIKHRKRNPKVIDRVNSVNRMFMSSDGTIRLYVNRKCREVIESVEQTIYKEHERQIDKSLNNEHMSDALGYPIEFQFPVREVDIRGISI